LRQTHTTGESSTLADGQRGPLRDGEVVDGRWRVRDPLGAGGVASVYAVWDVAQEGTQDSGAAPPVFALKIMHRDLALDSASVERFAREADVLEMCDLEGVVTYVSRGVHQRRPYLVMEYLEGTALDVLMSARDGKVSVEETIAIADTALATLALVHERGVVHRDLKPANIFLTRDGDVKILDFGAALLADDPRIDTGTRLGTPSYMAPEQAMNATLGVDERSDIFAFGATVFAMLTGSRVREGADSDETFVLAATTPVVSIARVAPELPLPLIQWVDDACAWNPSDRFPSASEMRTALHATQGDASDGLLARRDSLRALLSGAVEAAYEPDDDPVVRKAMKEALRALGGLLSAARRWGWQRDDTRSRLDEFMEHVRRSADLRCESVFFSVKPAWFACGDECLWEPDPPMDAIPYALFASGFRRVTIRPHVEVSELIAFVDVMLTDPLVDLELGDDLATLYNERGFRDVDVVLVTSFDLQLLDDYAGFDVELAELRVEIEEGLRLEEERSEAVARLSATVGRAGVVEATAMRVRVNQEQGDGYHSERSSVETLTARLDDEGAWPAERAAAILGHALRAAFDTGEAKAILRPMYDQVRALTRRRDAPAILHLLGGALSALRASEIESFLRACLDEPAVELLVTHGALHGELAQDEAYHALITRLPHGFVQSVAHVVNTTGDGQATRSIVAFMRHVAITSPQTLVSHIRELRARVATHVIDALEPSNPDALRVAREASGSPHETTRIAAARWRVRAGDESCQSDLTKLLCSSDPAIRASMANLSKEVASPVLGDALAAAILSDTFHEFSVSEKKQFLTALHMLDVKQAIVVATNVLKTQPLFSSTSVDASRAVAAEFLGQRSHERDVEETLRTEAKRFVRNTKTLRAVCDTAANQIASRLPSSGESA